MYKKGIKSIPRSIKKEIVNRLGDIFDSTDDIIPVEEKYEKTFLRELFKIHTIPSFWLISSKKEVDYYAIVFESKLNEYREIDIIYGWLDLDLEEQSASPYYGIYSKARALT